MNPARPKLGISFFFSNNIVKAHTQNRHFGQPKLLQQSTKSKHDVMLWFCALLEELRVAKMASCWHSGYPFGLKLSPGATKIAPRRTSKTALGHGTFVALESAMSEGCLGAPPVPHVGMPACCIGAISASCSYIVKARPVRASMFHGTLRPRDFYVVCDFATSGLWDFFTFWLWDFGGLLDLFTFGFRDFMTFRFMDF